MGMQSADSPAGRNKSKAAGISGKVSAPAGKKMATKSQPVVGKQGGSTKSMPGSKGKGPAVKTVESQKPTGKVGRGTTPMGNGLINGMI